ncbi:MAG TPA: hypothetical protein VMW27_08000, partial [Thermoanaerobaculia bacterium]|nr:hypothetical protein [Thermoanaerobaculia bacterium]
SEGAPASVLDLALVAEVERRLPDPDGFVAVVPEGPGGRAAARALALSLRTTNFFVLDRATADALPRVEGEPEERLGLYRLLRVRYRRWPVLLVEPAAGRRTIRSKISSRVATGSAQSPV